MQQAPFDYTNHKILNQSKKYKAVEYEKKLQSLI